jgi:hypothetical protein
MQGLCFEYPECRVESIIGQGRFVESDDDRIVGPYWRRREMREFFFGRGG